MSKKSLKDVAKIMRDLDLCMFTTSSPTGMSASRPMSNNSDVEFDGNSYFFTWAKSRLVRDIRKNPKVNLSFVGSKMLKKVFVSLSGRSKIIMDRSQMEEHWNKDLEIWFKDGLDTPGIAMIHVKAQRVKYWHGQDEGEIKIR